MVAAEGAAPATQGIVLKNASRFDSAAVCT